MQMQYVGTSSAVEAVLEQGFRRAFEDGATVPLEPAHTPLGGQAAVLLDIPEADLPPGGRFWIPAGIVDRYPVVAYRGVEPRRPRRKAQTFSRRPGATMVAATAVLLGAVASALAVPIGRKERRKTPRVVAIPPHTADAPASRSRRARRALRRHATQSRVVRRVIGAANQIATAPYRYGGGHGSFADGGYDCSGSVSYALHGGGLLAAPLDSSGLMSYGVPGPGAHITIYANPGHAYMTIDGRRFDTSARARTGSRWGAGGRSPAAYVVRHPPGL